MVHVDLEDRAFVDPSDDAQLVSNLVWAAGARAVEDVWVAGERVIEDGEPVLVDAARVRADLRRIASTLHP
jgi:5-methylthioadenosine/S-adenosylhomocysteine deaminase